MLGISGLQSIGWIGLFTSLLFGHFLLAQNVAAYEAIVNAPAQPYEIKKLEASFGTERWYLGEIKEFPHLYGLDLIENTELLLSLRIPSEIIIEEMRPMLLLVQVNSSQGVEEIMRMEFDSTVWREEVDARSGLRYHTPEVLTLDLPAGEYRIEISSADNQGKYMLVLGSDIKKESFATTWETVGLLHDFTDVSGLVTARLSMLYYPLATVFLLVLAAVTWRYRNRLFPSH